ncbi:MAG: hypothetical protein COV46_00840 [Deltaproteobacteria bacterium CG11_big_fil_rev_8_21_14_0_20_49_13]|nr:MAG: hypothetical protein COV46_00840 [Deltaproteobacteria bacterium CG11_big_fil_rev_8_21_14_0_20_49_13]
MSENNCKRLSLNDNCQISLNLTQCGGFVDVNGDEKDDFAIVNSQTTITADEFVSEPNYTIIYNGIDPTRFNDLGKYVETIRSVSHYNVDGTKSFRPDDIVYYKGNKYFLLLLKVDLTCSPSGAPSVDRTKTVAVIVPKGLMDMAVMYEENLAGIREKVFELAQKQKDATPEENQRIEALMKSYDPEFNKIAVAKLELEKGLNEGSVTVPMEELEVVK